MELPPLADRGAFHLPQGARPLQLRLRARLGRCGARSSTAMRSPTRVSRSAGSPPSPGAPGAPRRHCEAGRPRETAFLRAADAELADARAARRQRVQGRPDPPHACRRPAAVDRGGTPMSPAQPRPAVPTTPEGWSLKAGSDPRAARSARPHRRAGLAVGRTPQGPGRRALRRRVPDGGHGLRVAALQHDRSRSHHRARHQRRRGRRRRRAGHDPPQRPADGSHRRCS